MEETELISVWECVKGNPRAVTTPHEAGQSAKNVAVGNRIDTGAES